MILALDIGNTQIYGGVMEGDTIHLNFRTTSQGTITSDELGLFLRGMLRENGIDHSIIREIAICSVVPGLVHTVRACCLKYFDAEPLILQPGKKTGLKIKYKDPSQVGADRIANAIGAVQLFPGKNLIVVDYGTATTFDVVTAQKEYLGGAIVPGIRIGMESLSSRTAQLPRVDIARPDQFIGTTTAASIQSGLYYSNVAMLEYATRCIRKEAFGDAPCVLIGTGGFSRLFESENLFDVILPDLVLIGLMRFFEMNRE
jgi:type III pantothenate kinase